MAEFSIQSAAFTGVRVVREHPRFVAIWAVLSLVASVTITTSLIILAGADLQRLGSMAAGGYRDTPAVVSSFHNLLPAYAVTIPIATTFYGVLFDAMNRAILRPHDKKIAYFGFARDELLQIGVLAVVIMATIIGYFAIVLFLFVAGTLLKLNATAVAIIFVTMIAVGSIFFSVRFSLVPALNFQRGRISLRSSWKLTRTTFWPIVGVYILTLTLAAVVMMLAYLMILAVLVVLTGSLSSWAKPSDMSSLRSYFTASCIVQSALGAGVYALVWPVLLTPPAAIYLQLTKAGGAIDNPNAA